MEKTPESILIVGSGLFGLSTAWSLTKRPRFDETRITVVDNASAGGGRFPPEDSASVDASRIVRADYADTHYSRLGAEAQALWRQQEDGEVGGQGRYTENGFLIMASDMTTWPPAEVAAGKKTGMDYARTSWENVSTIASEAGQPEKIVKLGSRRELQEYVGTDGNPGDWGYLNKLSGWSDNGATMRWMYEQVRATGRVEFVDAQVAELVAEGRRVTGAKLRGDGRILTADVVFVAAGAWTGSLIDMRGRAEATGQILGYIDISKEEEERLRDNPTIMNLTTGMFILPPRNGMLKVARHGFGYLNPRTVTRALPPVASASDERPAIVTSVPRTTRDGELKSMPVEAAKGLRQALVDLLPRDMGMETRPWCKTRLCWYSDTRDADWIVDWHPGYDGLFVATGDSGHGFKFLPVIGDKLTDVFEGKGGPFAEKWSWKEIEDDGAGKVIDGVYKGIITEDGSRGGRRGMILDEELARKGEGVAAKL
ncbi:sarcosine oxidase / L-pipecolate oxidase [Geosmithia morbida]|uniref:Sarcosine oxidase / L-pipecolate oxidase n=1 Tax=Geosmithia morbida TaxID=1094350 RepID=A0A9P5D7B0_9HYPO|nr:sarcosine oxidase / L-pipecolate oxidase [Geosmithia morbida]KAF4125615.1 sarcosine oxidase / L-pipecolate oxidase [Geosmithia morbida]